MYPEFSADWIVDELKNHPFEQREHDKFYITEEDRDELLEIAEFWQGKTVEDMVNAGLSEAEKAGSELGKKAEPWTGMIRIMKRKPNCMKL